MSSESQLEFPDSITVGKKLGSGAFGEVYEGTFTDPRTNSPLVDVAIKVIDLTKIPKRAVQAQLQETKIAQSITSDGVVKVYAQVETKTALFIVMEKMDYDATKVTKRMRTLLTEGKYGDIVRIIKPQLIRLLKALKAIHQECIVHRDIKPANILVNDETGDMKIGDFGVSCFVKECNNIAGAFNWMEPSCVSLGMFKYKDPDYLCRITHWSDIYSLGLSIVFILTGQVVMKTTPKTQLQFEKQLTVLRNYLKHMFSLDKSRSWQTLIYLLAAMTNPDPLQRPSPDQAIAFLDTMDASVFETMDRDYVTC
jgi:serine/threonine protein kinase